MTATQTAFQALFANFAGLAVISTDKTGVESRYKIASLTEKIGTMKDGTKAEYVLLQREDDDTVVIQLHPNTASKLFKKSEADSFKIAPVSADEILAAEEEAALQAELDVELTGTVGEPELAFEEKAAEEVKEPSKKERALAIFAEVTAAGGARKETIARFTTELGLSAPGASTYYQNCKKLWKA